MKKKQSQNELGETSFRKLSHLEICLSKSVEAFASPRWEDFHLIHRALPEMDFEEIDTQVTLFGKKLSLPLIAAAMTGGHPDVRPINEIIAKVAQKFNFGMGVGSQRAAIEKNVPYITESFQIVRELAPDVLIIGNLGAAQFSEKGKFNEIQAQKAIDMVKANVLAIHVNPAQEVVQLEGDTCFKGVLSQVEKVAKKISVPLILKEVGSGFGQEEAEIIEKSSIAGIDVGGLGGTSWVGVEALRAMDKGNTLCHEIGKLFWDWGIPTAISIVEVRSKTQKPIIATGGVRNGMQAAKAIALGANAVGMALPLLKAAKEGMESLEKLVIQFMQEFKIAMFLTGAKNIEELRKVPVIVTGFSREWIMERGIDFPNPSVN